jgi:crotonobetainyl-CoA:carnitine CoA-transferase CaiB-like acyl-CoA transferase
MALLTDLHVVQLGDGLCAAVCGRLMADLGATVECVEARDGTLLGDYLNHGKVINGKPGADQAAIATADLILCEGSPATLRARRWDVASLRRINARAAVVDISPFGQSGPRAEEPATDLTLFYASGIARLLTGQVDDLKEPPIRPVGQQSAFLGGIAAACAAMHAVQAAEPGAVVDVSVHEVLATLAMTELARAGTTGRSWSRKRVGDGNGSTVCILPARDGYAAISPREDRQWASWLKAMGSPAWSGEARFATKADRAANWDALHPLMCAWSGQYDKQWIADTAQAAHVPSFPLREPAEHLPSEQLRHRGFYADVTLSHGTVKAPGPPFGLRLAQGTGGRRLALGTDGRRLALGAMPLAGVRVLDFSWVIAGPTTTRYLAAMGAEVIKVEAPGRGDPGRASELHSVLGQAKKAIVLDLKKPEAVEIARALAGQCDVLVENFATGVMDRLGLGAVDLRAVNPDLIYVSASGLGRTGPEAHAVAYGTLLQCYAGFAGLNRHPDIPPRVGFAWLDPMCGLMLAFVTAASVWHRARAGEAARVDFSMVEAMLWTMAEPLLAAQQGATPQPIGNGSAALAPHGAWRCTGEDDWVAVAIRHDADWRALCEAVPALSGGQGLAADMDVAQRRENRGTINRTLTAWAAERGARDAAALLTRRGIPAAALARSLDLVECPHLRARGFWDEQGSGVLPGLPWRASFGRVRGPAPGLGADTNAVLRDVLGLPTERVATLRAAGALG